MNRITIITGSLIYLVALSACSPEKDLGADIITTTQNDNNAEQVTSQNSKSLVKLPSNISTVDVTQDTSRRFGAPHVAVNPRNPNNVVVLASSNLGYTRDCLPPTKGSDCEMIEVESFPLPRPRGYTNTAGFMDIGVFVSHDRGQSFDQVDISDLVPPDDPMVRSRGEGPIAVTPDGTFYIGFNAINWGNWASSPQTFFPNGGVGVIRSTDSGKTWEWASYSHTPANWPYGGADSITGTLYVTSGIAGMTPLGPRSTGDPNSPTGATADRWISSTDDGFTWTDPQPLGGQDEADHVGAGHSSVDAAHGVVATMFVAEPENCGFFSQDRYFGRMRDIPDVHRRRRKLVSNSCSHPKRFQNRQA